MKNDEAKNSVKSWWEEHPCNAEWSKLTTQSKEYYDAIEKERYRMEPCIPPFARFDLGKNKKILEVGVGIGTDFIQWAKSGANAYGIDMTEQAISYTKKRLEVYNLKVAELKQSDAENLEFDTDYFDLVYSWGVIHHTPDMEKAFAEIVRVCNKNGEIKLMLYNRHSIFVFITWMRFCLFKGHFWKSLKYAVGNFVESPGTKAYTRSEIRSLLKKYPVDNIKIETVLAHSDLRPDWPKFYQKILLLLASIFGGDNVGWFMLIKMKKK